VTDFYRDSTPGKEGMEAPWRAVVGRLRLVEQEGAEI
jgi:hypothetical protein